MHRNTKIYLTPPLCGTPLQIWRGAGGRGNNGLLLYGKKFHPPHIYVIIIHSKLNLAALPIPSTGSGVKGISQSIFINEKMEEK